MVKVAGIVVALLFSLPLWLFLVYKILVHIEATELMWFLFYLYAPTVFLSSILLKLFESEKK